MNGAVESGAGREGWADETGVLWLHFNRCGVRLCTRGLRLTVSTRASVKEILWCFSVRLSVCLVRFFSSFSFVVRFNKSFHQRTEPRRIFPSGSWGERRSEEVFSFQHIYPSDKAMLPKNSNCHQLQLFIIVWGSRAEFLIGLNRESHYMPAGVDCKST